MPDLDPMAAKHEHEHEPEVDADADVVMQSYPSPTAHDQDSAPFYNTNSRQDQLPQSELDQQVGEQGQLEELPIPRQQMRPTISSAEELQLAAQLSQGLAHGLPMMDPNEDPNLQHVMAQHNLDQQEQELHHDESHLNHDHDHDHEQLHHDGLAQHEGLQHNGDNTHENMHEHLHDHVNEHDQSMAQHESPDQQLQHHEQHLQGQQSQQPQQQYISDQHQQQPHLQPAASMDHLAQQFQMPGDTPPRKRSKVSRACDECRRKKVKCDAPSETGDEPCSNCRRSSMRCLFSRVPQKRGPSKGYIKELADRIHHIEGKLASEGGNVESLTELLTGSRRDSSDLFGAGQADELGRKRPYSSISGGEFDTPNPSRQQTFSSEPRPIQPYQASADRARPPYSANGLAPIPIAAKTDYGTPSRPAAVMDGISLDLNHLGQAREVDETVFAA